MTNYGWVGYGYGRSCLPGSTWASIQMRQNVGRIRTTQNHKQRTLEGGRHNITASRENGMTSGSRSRMTKMLDVGAGDKSAGGTRIKNNMRVKGAVYRGER